MIFFKEKVGPTAEQGKELYTKVATTLYQCKKNYEKVVKILCSPYEFECLKLYCKHETNYAGIEAIVIDGVQVISTDLCKGFEHEEFYIQSEDNGKNFKEFTEEELENIKRIKII